MEGMAYGAGKAGGAFNPITFFQQPHTILRILSWFFSIVIFGSIANEGYVNRPDEAQEFCIFNRNQNACNYGLFMGTMAFLCCLAFLALDVYFPQISSVKDRRKAVLADVGVSAFWSFMWFVGFCFLTNQWQAAKQEDNPLREGGDAARAAITFAFFSIFTWTLFTSPPQPQLCPPTPLSSPHPSLPKATQSFFGYQRYQLGADSALFSQDYIDPSLDAGAAGDPYTSFTAGGDDLGQGDPVEGSSYQGNNGEGGGRYQEY
ncbi:synaptogyrin-1-like [Salvelinus namaycush]|uniref:Synaptogyrin n=1 Tax=Salvelinus namaycush TaxID=8040 RepID=A0A8U0U0G2_SALNM|nr:synaptogyrin-1-like [Salvelinus namaycush]